MTKKFVDSVWFVWQKDELRLKEMFIQVFMESVYSLHSLADLGTFSVAEPQQQVILFCLHCLCISFGLFFT